jgi:multicomponent K+:H+ antiporter subunit E
MKAGLPLLGLSLVAMWLVLNETVSVGQALLGAIVALAAVRGLRLLQPPSPPARQPMVAFRLARVVLLDIARSNLAVAAIVLRPRTGRHRSGFVDIPLELRHPAGLAVLACIITATPGTSWAGYDSRASILTMHILDLVDAEASIRAIKDRYERKLMEIFE